MPRHYEVYRIVENVMTVGDNKVFEAFCLQVISGQGWRWLLNEFINKDSMLIPRETGPDASIANMAKNLRGLRQRSGFTCSELSNSYGRSSKKENERAFFEDIINTLADDASSAAVMPPPKNLTIPSTKREKDITLESIDKGKGWWLLLGGTSRSWGSGVEVSKSVLNALPPFGSVNGLKKDASNLESATVKQWLAPLGVESKNSCLVGFMVADLVDMKGRNMRVVSLSANQMEVGNIYSAHITRGQKGSQVHMEIFNFERLGALINHLKIPLCSVEIFIHGLKTNDVVGENNMCKACQPTFMKEIVENKLNPNGKKDNVDVLFHGP